MTTLQYLLLGYLILNLILIFILELMGEKWIEKSYKFYRKSISDYFNIFKGGGFVEIAVLVLFTPLGIIAVISAIIFKFVSFPIVFFRTIRNRKIKNNITVNTTNNPTSKKFKTISPVFLKFSTELTFTPESNQIIYVETVFNDRVNEELENNYNTIKQLFEKKEYNFVYLPLLIHEMNVECVTYHYPELSHLKISRCDIFAQFFLDNILHYQLEQTFLSGGLIRFKKTENGVHYFSYFEFEDVDEYDIIEQSEAYLNSVGDALIMFHIDTEKEYDADENFSFEVNQLIDEIKERINTLRQTGINEFVLKKLFAIEESKKLSRLVITKDYKIILPDFNNLEITMHPLPKAVYLLFLNHPEGIMFKNLPMYEDELIGIYKNISGRENIKAMRKSIADVVNPTKNSINEKCSRIREAFVQHFDDSIAQNYFITGTRGKPKLITLKRELVTIE